jgi:hypothetical protein
MRAWLTRFRRWRRNRLRSNLMGDRIVVVSWMRVSMTLVAIPCERGTDSTKGEDHAYGSDDRDESHLESHELSPR